MKNYPLPEWKTEARLIEYESELPEWFGAQNLYLDLETTSGQDKESSLNVWKNCKILGVAVLIDNEKYPIYIPLRHRGPQTKNNLNYDNVKRWLQRVISTSKKWINHNIKYDAHVLINEGFDITGPQLIDSIILCKLAPKEERFTYNLTDIMSEWFYVNIYPLEEKLHIYLNSITRGVKDYGLLPIDYMCPYSCVDVLAVRKIYTSLMDIIPEECSKVLALELAVTPVLLDIENTGMSLNMELLNVHNTALPGTLMLIERQLKKLTSYDELRPHANADCKAVFMDHYGLPVIEWTNEKKISPAFGSDVILAYKAMKPEISEVCDWFLKYKELHKLYTGFTAPYLELNVDGLIHCDYNQIVRTGRMSCRTPNMQQLSDEAKEYIIPFGPDRILVDIDFSQIEYRLIAHFVRAEHIIREYNVNPNADYHKITADICGIERKEAKRINFCLSYNGGRGRVISILKGVPEVIERCQNIEVLGNSVYAKFHSTVPTLRSTAQLAANLALQRGYVRTLLKRRRYLPRKVRFKAFNTVIQGSAADLFKGALIRAWQRKAKDTKLIGCVHDSYIFDMPREGSEEEIHRLINAIEEVSKNVELRVPIRASAKFSDKNWRCCK